jgi:hypothetical protein
LDEESLPAGPAVQGAFEECSSFTSGESCTLVNAEQVPTWAIPIAQSTGQVKVSVTETTVLFTVSKPGYFASVGSTIEFRTTARHGDLYLQQIGKAKNANTSAKLGIALGLGKATWVKQANNLRRLL